MPNSKSDPKSPPRVMDVTQPGKSAPSSSGRPIIVSNRPILKQDPMVVTPDDTEEQETLLAPSAARAAKSATIVRPLSDTEPAFAAPATPAAAAPVSAPAVTPVAVQAKEPGISPHSVKIVTEPDLGLEKAPDKKVVAEEVGREALDSSGLPEVKPAEPADPKPEKETAKPSETPKPEAERAPAPTAIETKTPETPKAATEPSPTPATPPAPEAPANSNTTTDTEKAGDQLAPNQAMDEAKQREEAAKAALLEEQEKIIASKQFYLPIQNVAAKRGNLRSFLVLVVVVVLALAWIDAVLDAGIVHISGVHALTHFFK